MYGIFTYIYHKNQPNVGKYTIHGWYGYVGTRMFSPQIDSPRWKRNLPLVFGTKIGPANLFKGSQIPRTSTLLSAPTLDQNQVFEHYLLDVFSRLAALFWLEFQVLWLRKKKQKGLFFRKDFRGETWPFGLQKTVGTPQRSVSLGVEGRKPSYLEVQDTYSK